MKDLKCLLDQLHSVSQKQQLKKRKKMAIKRIRHLQEAKLCTVKIKLKRQT